MYTGNYTDVAAFTDYLHGKLLFTWTDGGSFQYCIYP
jgi:hypothetical protein